MSSLTSPPAVEPSPAQQWWNAKGAEPSRSEVAIADTRRIDLVSRTNGRRYSLSIAMPWGPPPDDGYSALYVLDSYAFFGSAVEATRLTVLMPGVVVVGVGYPDDREFADEVLERRRPVPPWMLMGPRSIAAYTLARQQDLTLPASEAALAAWSTPGVLTYASEATGGVDDFLRMIEDEAKPLVRALAPINDANTAVFGHSLGGLAVVRALFTIPRAFRTFIAASPALSWGDGAVLQGEATFTQAVAAGSLRPRVLLTVGGDEGRATNIPSELVAEPVNPELAEIGSHAVRDVTALAGRLKALEGDDGCRVDLAVFPAQGHGISPWPALGRAVSFAFLDA
ncbi:MAG: alpha/beta hydrolase [Gemmatimonadaceae bacterium]|nr:alpha/beta hydrolase [Gemmatimonadaceae bacterium]